MTLQIAFCHVKHWALSQINEHKAKSCHACPSSAVIYPQTLNCWAGMMMMMVWGWDLKLCLAAISNSVNTSVPWKGLAERPRLEGLWQSWAVSASLTCFRSGSSLDQSRSQQGSWREDRGGPWCVTLCLEPKTIWLCLQDCTHPCDGSHCARAEPWLSKWLTVESITCQPPSLGAAMTKSQWLEKVSISLQCSTDTAHGQTWLPACGRVMLSPHGSSLGTARTNKTQTIAECLWQMHKSYHFPPSQ